MTTKNYFGDYNYCNTNFGIKSAHCDSAGGMPGDRISAFGYGPAAISENAAAGFSTAQAVFDAWKSSSGHNANMLRSYWVAIGIARACQSGTTYGCYWVTDFGDIDSPPGPNQPYPPSTPTPTPSPMPTPTLKPTPSPSPSPSPSPRGLTWEDLDCDQSILPQDAVTLLMNDAGLRSSGPAVAGGCPAPSESVFVDGAFRLFGDIDCSGAISAVDSIKLLLWLIGIPVESSDPGCPAPGVTF